MPDPIHDTIHRVPAIVRRRCPDDVRDYHAANARSHLLALGATPAEANLIIDDLEARRATK